MIFFVEVSTAVTVVPAGMSVPETASPTATLAMVPPVTSSVVLELTVAVMDVMRKKVDVLDAIPNVVPDPYV